MSKYERKTAEPTIRKFYIISDVPSAKVVVGPRPSSVEKPPAIQFVHTDKDYMRNQPIGTLLFNQEDWDRWFKGKELYDNFKDAETAVQTLLAREDYWLGCPICSHFRTKQYEEYEKHLLNHREQLRGLLGD